jgi:hypothetical protein
VRTFRGPALDAAGDAPRGPVTTLPRTPAPTPDAAAAPSPETGTRGWVPRPRPTPAPDQRAFTDADLRAYAAQRGAEAVRDARYRLALRQRRVDELRARIAAAQSDDERSQLQAWLAEALRDLQAEREAN